MAVPRRRADQAAAGGAGPAGLEPGGSRVAGKQLVQRAQVIRLVARRGRDVDCLRTGDRGQGGEVSIEVRGGDRQVGGRGVVARVVGAPGIGEMRLPQAQAGGQRVHPRDELGLRQDGLRQRDRGVVP